MLSIARFRLRETQASEAQRRGVVRKKLGLDLRSEKVDGNRVYRIVRSGGARSAAFRPSRRRAA